MADVTINVDAVVADRLAVLAAERGTTIRESWSANWPGSRRGRLGAAMRR